MGLLDHILPVAWPAAVSVFFLIVAIGVLVTFHEAGHFFVARWTGVHVVRFCVGFGKVLWRRRDRHGTEFAIAALPLGGYVRLYDRRDPDAAETAPADPAAARRSYDRLKPQWRIAIAAAGPAANFVLAFVFFWLVAVLGTQVATPTAAIADGSAAHDAGMRSGAEIIAVDGRPTATWREANLALVQRLGESGSIEIDTLRDGEQRRHAIAIESWHAESEDPDPLRSLGIAPLDLPYIGSVEADGAAAEGGIEAHDLVTQVNGRPIAEWGEFVEVVRGSPGASLQLTVLRGDGARLVTVTPRLRFDDAGDEYGYVGVTAGLQTRLQRDGVFAALGVALGDTWRYTALTVQMIGKMATLSISPKNVAGPITIAKVSADSARAGVAPFLLLLAILSINLGIVNLLPIPVLDGGQIVLNALHLVRGKPVSALTEAMTGRVGIALVAGLMVLVFYADFLRWF